MRNLHKYYYKDYFSPGISFDDICKVEEKENLPKTDVEGKEKLSKEISDIQDNNKKIIKKRNEILTSGTFAKNETGKPLRDELIIKNDISPTEHRFSLRITYPGLVTGVGINHEAKIEGEFKLGVHFDWTHGMPLVYGSSVKGMLRSAFKDGYVDASLIRDANKNIKEEDNVPEWVGNPKFNKNLIEDIFEGKGKSIYDRDIFFDAVITNADPKGRILCSDSITPHPGPLKNPTPITFLKIAPGCLLEFRFKLTDSTINGETFTASQKLTLFKEILTTVGVGAKTNVGYGQLKSI